MKTRGSLRSRRPVAERTSSPDEGFTLVEVLVSIMLIGTAVVATLFAMNATILGSRTERDHAKAHQWLQSAVQLVEEEEFGDCRDEAGVTPSSEQIRLFYQQKVHAVASSPYGWTDAQIAIKPIDVWTGTQWIPYTEATACYDNVGFRMQRVTIEVASPDGRIIESVEVVKSV